MSDVRVHYNSAQPAQMQALAYTQGTDIHVGPGQEQHLPHEAWHVVQQKQGRVQPTMQATGVQINDDEGLEHEADVMGAQALQTPRLAQVATGSIAQAASAELRERESAEASDVPRAEKMRVNVLSTEMNMSQRQHETTTPAVAHVLAAPETATVQPPQLHPQLPLPPSASSTPRPQAYAAALTQASGGQLTRAGVALRQLQQGYGNRYVQQVVHHARTAASPAPVSYPAPPIQAKLTIGQPHDRYEQEADRVASQVVTQIHAYTTPARATQGQPVQCQEELGEALQAKLCISDLQQSPLSPEVQREVTPEEADIQAQSILQRREAIADGEASMDFTDLDTAINSARGNGQSLDVGLQQSIGQTMGADFSGVRVHTDAQSDLLNRSLQAKAFTAGQDVFFRRGAYDPKSRGGAGVDRP
jgi:hypothetical protein